MVDGGFLKKKLYKELGKRPATAQDIVQKCQAIASKPELKNHELFRIFYYDAPPLGDKSLTNPLDNSTVNFSQTPQGRQLQKQHDQLALERHFALRMGELTLNGWQISNKTIKQIAKKQRHLAATDLQPNISQKGVDMRIGLDIASLSTKRVVDILVLVTGDSDFVPAMKTARREGLLVYLEAMEHGVNQALKVHSDIVL